MPNNRPGLGKSEKIIGHKQRITLQRVTKNPGTKGTKVPNPIVEDDQYFFTAKQKAVET